jgi:hypothetical protein
MRWQEGYLEKDVEEACNRIGIILANHLKQCSFHYLFAHIRSKLGRSSSTDRPIRSNKLTQLHQPILETKPWLTNSDLMPYYPPCIRFTHHPKKKTSKWTRNCEPDRTRTRQPYSKNQRQIRGKVPKRDLIPEGSAGDT